MNAPANQSGRKRGEAILSGQAGRAFVRTLEGLFTFTIDERTPVSCSPTQLAQLRILYQDVEQAPADDFPFPAVYALLELRWQCDRALLLALTGADMEVPEALRGRGLELADGLVGRAEVHDFVSDRLFGRPVPPDADFEGAIRLAESGGANKMAALFREVLAARHVIEVVCGARRSYLEFLPTPADRTEVNDLLELSHASGPFVRALLRGVPSEAIDWIVAVSPGLQHGKHRTEEYLAGWLRHAIESNVSQKCSSVGQSTEAGPERVGTTSAASEESVGTHVERQDESPAEQSQDAERFMAELVSFDRTFPRSQRRRAEVMLITRQVRERRQVFPF